MKTIGNDYLRKGHRLKQMATPTKAETAEHYKRLAILSKLWKTLNSALEA